MTRKLREYLLVTLKLEDLDGQIDFVRVFGRPGPVHIEVGTGKATFLLNEAKRKPHINFIGIERANKDYRYAVDRIGRWNLSNVRIIRTDAAAFLADFISEASVDCFHIYFPDPWPKRRHHKRRFFCPANLEHLVRCLKTGGRLRIATDQLDYFEWIRSLIAAQNERLQEIEFLPSAGASSGELTGTNYERKYLKEHRPIYAIAVRKL